MESLQRHAAESRQSDAPVSVPAPETGGNDLLKILYREDLRFGDDRFGGKTVHASSLSKLPRCARMFYLGNYMREQGMTFPSSTFGAMKLVWAYGRAAEKHVRETLLKDPEMRRSAYGIWRCMCKTTQSRGHLPITPAICPNCKSRADVYDEPTLVDRLRGISGNPDFMYLQGARYRVVEIKSIKAEGNASNPGFKELEQPIPGHVEQGTHYIRLYENEGMAVHPVPYILYVKKEFDPRKWYKLLIPSDAQMARAREDVEATRAVAQRYTEARHSGVLPARLPECVHDRECQRKKCPVWMECMSRGTE